MIEYIAFAILIACALIISYWSIKIIFAKEVIPVTETQNG